MSVLIVTSLGDIVVDLHTDRCPLTTKNFLKLSKIKYFNGCLFHTVQKDFTAQTGDPTGKGTGGDSIYKFLYGEQARFFGDEIHPELKHFKTGTVSMASAGENLNASQFYFTLRDDLEYLDGKHTVFGEVAEGLETLARINEAYVDEKGRPYKNIRIKHTYVLDDPFDDPPQLPEFIPDASPEGKPKDEIDDDVRLEDDWVPMDEKLDPSELEEVLREKEAHSRAVVLESIGDIPDSEIKPPDNVLFVCKLNPVTEDDDLNTIFSRFGNVVSADIIRDYKTGDSLCYAFIEFETTEACEQAYFKMDNALIDDRRIHVDFSQSVAKLWSQYRRKDNQRGGGCFKCGAADHIAKDCTGGPSTKMLPPKYTLKDENTQRGGDDNSRYEMVFDGDTPVSSEGDKRRRGREPDDQNGKQRMDKRISEDIKYRDREKRDSTNDRHKHDERSRGLKEDERNRGSRRDEEYHVVKETRDKVNLKSHGSHRDGRDEQDYRKKESHGDRREERDYRKKDSLRDRRDDRDYRKKGADSDGRGDRRDERDYKKRSADSDGRGDRRDERDYKKRSADSDGRGDRRDERDYRKRGADSDGCGDRREDRDSTKRSVDDDHDHRSGRRHQIEKRR